MRKRSISVSFRVSEDIIRLLDARALEVNLSRGELARSLVISALSNAPSDEVRDVVDSMLAKLNELKDPLARIEKKFAYQLYVLLRQVGEVPPDEAKRIVKEEFLSKGNLS